MKIFGFNITKATAYNKAMRDAKHEGLYEVVELLKKKDKIYLAPVNLKGDGHVISDCVFFGDGKNPSVNIPPEKYGK